MNVDERIFNYLVDQAVFDTANIESFTPDARREVDEEADSVVIVPTLVSEVVSERYGGDRRPIENSGTIAIQIKSEKLDRLQAMVAMAKTLTKELLSGTFNNEVVDIRLLAFLSVTYVYDDTGSFTNIASVTYNVVSALDTPITGA